MELEQALGIALSDPHLAEVALTHRSYAFEHDLDATNERLEFLGDAVLGLVIAEMAFSMFPDMTEGELAKLRAATVSMTTLAGIARELGLGKLVRLGKGEEQSGGREKASILADCLEAVLGAVYVDRGFEETAALIRRLFKPAIEAYVQGGGSRDYKTSLQELASQDFGGLPEYRIAERGPDHQKEFTATVLIAGREMGVGTGRSKKQAEQAAAAQALARIGRLERG